MRTIKDYIETIHIHQAEGRQFSQIDHVELIEWQNTLWELEEKNSKLESERNSLIRDAYDKDMT